MRRSTRINLALLALILVLGLMIWLSPTVDRQSTTGSLTQLQPEEIQLIVIRNRQGEFTLERGQGGVWRMTQPREVLADGERIADLLNILQTPSYQSFPLPADDLSEFGLQPNSPSMQLDELRLEMGGIHPYNQRRYLRIDGRIHLIKDRFPHHFLATAEAFVSPRRSVRNAAEGVGVDTAGSDP